MFGWFKRKTSKREIIINAEKLEVRAAVVVNGKLEEFELEHPTEERIVGCIFKGRIQNLEHDLQAAFVDIGLKKNAFLHYWDMIADDESALMNEEGEGGRRPSSRRKRRSNEEIEKEFAPGTEIVVQVTKGAIGTKGPRVTAALSIPGRYLVLVPGSKLRGVSRKIADDGERGRLKKVAAGLELREGLGIIVRTAASGAKKGHLEDDLEFLVNTWDELQAAIRAQAAPCCVYREPDLAERVIRDWMTEEVDRIVVDDPATYERIKPIAARVPRRARAKLQLYEGERPIFEHYEIEQEIEAAFRRKVPLQSGAYLVIDETEALISIDVNTGRHKGKGSQEEAILAVNLEAVEEVARQLRLRNIGGLLVIDLIDMKSRKHQQQVYKAMKEALKNDRARVNVLPISDLGLMEMTRQRVDESLLSTVHTDCPYCHGRGSVKSALGVSVEVQRQLYALLRKRKRGDKSQEIQVVVHPTVLDRMRREDEEFLIDLEKRLEGHLSFRSDPARHMESFLIRDGLTNEVLYSNSEH